MFDISSQPSLLIPINWTSTIVTTAKAAVVERSVVGGFISGINQERLRNRMNKRESLPAAETCGLPYPWYLPKAIDKVCQQLQ